MKFLTVVLGILMIISGIWILASPGSSYAALPWALGICMIIEGIGQIFTWSSRRKAGLAGGWSLAGSIISVLAGIILVSSNFMQAATDLFLVYFFAAWLLVVGIMSIGKSIQDASNSGSLWWLNLISGILLVICGVICFFNPFSGAITIGIFAGICVLFTGIDMICMAMAF